ncbi:MAG TPA: hypothetical protein PKJ70_03845 [Chitinophagaceae bacterium]|nr:hypothetical protein [Chitinophagaceae bacterium]MCC6634582.1 hypothetical protein [Chitinophagaceae bacterium]HNE93415.1 hypothetical protein [Chitinophagaceae bacterium]HNJ58674.1 hypothetical protein [Chitinophagaceae bacterium]HNM33694.1 hypothetical protein [Chitinophagaceae bacterium]
MAIVLTFDPTIEKVVELLEKMSEKQKKYILSECIAVGIYGEFGQNLKKISLQEIDRIKHETRKQNAKQKVRV